MLVTARPGALSVSFVVLFLIISNTVCKLIRSPLEMSYAPLGFFFLLIERSLVSGRALCTGSSVLIRWLRESWRKLGLLGFTGWTWFLRWARYW